MYTVTQPSRQQLLKEMFKLPDVVLLLVVPFAIALINLNCKYPLYPYVGILCLFLGLVFLVVRSFLVLSLSKRETTFFETYLLIKKDGKVIKKVNYSDIPCGIWLEKKLILQFGKIPRRQILVLHQGLPKNVYDILSATVNWLEVKDKSLK